MEACRNFHRPAAREKPGVPGPSICKAVPLKKDLSGPWPCYAMEVEVVLMRSFVLCTFFFFFFFLFLFLVFFLLFFLFSLLFFSRLLQEIKKRNYRLNEH